MTTDQELTRQRMKEAARDRRAGSAMMVAGGMALVGAVATFAGFDSTEVPSWVRQLTFTLVSLLFATGIAMLAVGRAERRIYHQMADDREGQRTREASQAARHEELMKELREIKRRQIFLMERPGAGGANGTSHPPGPDTLDMLIRREQMTRRPRRIEQVEAQPTEERKELSPDPVDPKYLADMSEAVRLGEEIARRKLQPPDQQPN